MRLLAGNCLERMAELDAGSIDAVVTDPPYGLEFMGKGWDKLDGTGMGGWATGATTMGHSDGSFKRPMPQFGSNRNPVCLTCHKHRRGTESCSCQNPAFDETPADSNRAMQAWHEAWARQAIRVLKPGGHLLAFGGTRTYHRLAAGIEDAGFEIRDCLAWLYGSGFPKSLDVSKAIDAAAGAEREVVGTAADFARDGANRVGSRHADTRTVTGFAGDTEHGWDRPVTAPATDDAARWSGWGTALKPAFEPVVLARKPLAGTVARNVLEHGTGALNVDGCRIEHDEPRGRSSTGPHGRRGGIMGETVERHRETTSAATDGRWPANVIVDEQAAAMLDEQTEILTSGPESDKGHRRNADRDAARNTYGGFQGQEVTGVLYGDSGGASRFFYCPKVSRAERNAGLDGLEKTPADTGAGNDRGARRVPGGWEYDREPHPRANTHPTVKPIELMRWLVRLVTPPDGLVLDPFLGSGTTGVAAGLEGFRFVGIERDPDYLKIAAARIAWWAEHGEQALETFRAQEAAEDRREETADAGQIDIFAELA